MDISERKMNEEIQRLRVVEAEQRRVEAEEAKHQQELLIDITSYVLLNVGDLLNKIVMKSEIPSVHSCSAHPW